MPVIAIFNRINHTKALKCLDDTEEYLCEEFRITCYDNHNLYGDKSWLAYPALAFR